MPPVGGSRRSRLLPLAALMGGAVAGSVLLSLGLGVVWLVVHLLPAARTGVVVGTVGVSLLATSWRSLGAWIPDRSFQVNKALLHSRSRGQAAVLWGVELGTGLTTLAVTPALYGLCGVIVAQPHFASLVLLCLCYGATRGGAIVSFSLLRARRSTACGSPVPGLGLRDRMKWPILVASAIAGVLTVL